MLYSEDLALAAKTDLFSPARILREHGLRPKKRLGQNFLVYPGLSQALIEASELKPEDMVLEVGAGLGTLTQALAAAAGRVIAVEVDRSLIPILRENLASFPNVQVVEGDILTLDLGEVVPGPYKLVGNLPYYLTSHLLRHFLEATNKPRLMVVTVQREVAERIAAQPGEMSLLAMSVQFYGRPRIVLRVPRGAFYPPPEVFSALVRIDLEQNFRRQVEDEGAFFTLVRAGFSQKRKYLKNSLAGGLRISVEKAARLLVQARIGEKSRAQDLSVEDWVRLYQVWMESHPRSVRDFEVQEA